MHLVVEGEAFVHSQAAFGEFDHFEAWQHDPIRYDTIDQFRGCSEVGGGGIRGRERGRGLRERRRGEGGET